MKGILAGLLVLFTTIVVADMVPTFAERSVDSHNYQRNRLNNGLMNEQPIPDPFIRNMYWDQDTADNAQNHTDQCVWEHSSRSDRDNAGENIAAGYGSIERTVTAWTNEERNYDYDTNSSSGVTGHYTQVVWNNSTRLGCGRTYCSPIYNSDGSVMWNGDFIACQYQKPGNYAGQRPYSVKGDVTGTVPTYSSNTNEVIIPFVEVDVAPYRAKLQMVTQESPFLFTITVLDEVTTGNSGGYGTAIFNSSNNNLFMPIVKVDGVDYEVKMRHRGNGILELISIE